MKKAVSVSLGSSERDKKVEIDVLGETVLIERRGTDGDVAKATALFNELDGQVDALGVGGIDLWVAMGDRKIPITAAHKMVKGVKKTPLVDGSGLKNTLEGHAAQYLVKELGADYASGRVMMTMGVDRYGLTLGFFDQGYEVACCDLMFALDVPIPVRSLRMLKFLGRTLAPLAARLPIDMLYPTGEKQDEIVPKFTKWYDWATVIAGDCHYIRRHMPDDLKGKVIVTNTTTAKDMDLFRERGVSYVMTMTPVINGRSFGTNMMEAALTAAADKGRTLTYAEIANYLEKLDFKPTIHDLQQAE